jgi:hypothetical protein
MTFESSLACPTGTTGTFYDSMSPPVLLQASMPSALQFDSTSDDTASGMWMYPAGAVAAGTACVGTVCIHTPRFHVPIFKSCILHRDARICNVFDLCHSGCDRVWHCSQRSSPPVSFPVKCTRTTEEETHRLHWHLRVLSVTPSTPSTSMRCSLRSSFVGVRFSNNSHYSARMHEDHHKSGGILPSQTVTHAHKYCCGADFDGTFCSFHSVPSQALGIQ